MGRRSAGPHSRSLALQVDDEAKATVSEETRSIARRMAKVRRGRHMWRGGEGAVSR